MNVPSIEWLIIEDAEVLNPNVAEIASRSGIPFIHLIGECSDLVIYLSALIIR